MIQIGREVEPTAETVEQEAVREIVPLGQKARVKAEEGELAQLVDRLHVEGEMTGEVNSGTHDQNAPSGNLQNRLSRSPLK